MKVMIEEIEEFEVTDPAGCCNPPMPQRGQPVPQGIPIRPNVNPGFPQLPTPVSPSPTPAIPGIGDIKPAHFPPIYTKNIHDPDDPFLNGEWGIGGPMIQQAGQDVDPETWERNWQSSPGVTGEDNGNQHTH